MIHLFIVCLTHTIPIDRWYIPLYKIVYSQNFIQYCCLHKEWYFLRHVTRPNASPCKKLPASISKMFIIRSNTIAIHYPYHTISTSSKGQFIIKQIHKKIHPLHLPIMKIMNKSHIPIVGAILPSYTHHRSYRRILFFFKVNRSILIFSNQRQIQIQFASDPS